MAGIEIYTKVLCPFCGKAKSLLKSMSLNYREIDITFNRDRANEMMERSQRHTVPQIFIEGRSVGGYDDLVHLKVTGGLERMLGGAAAT